MAIAKSVFTSVKSKTLFHAVPRLIPVNGEDGTAATIGIGSVTTLPAGSSATVVNSGTENAAVLDFGLPAGAQGEDGATISAGTGAPSTDGDTGDLYLDTSTGDLYEWVD